MSDNRSAVRRSRASCSGCGSVASRSSARRSCSARTWTSWRKPACASRRARATSPCCSRGSRSDSRRRRSTRPTAGSPSRLPRGRPARRGPDTPRHGAHGSEPHAQAARDPVQDPDRCGARAARCIGSVVGDTLLLLVVRSSPAQADTHHIRLPGPVLLPTLVPLAVALGERPKAGAKLTLPMFDPIAMAPRDVHIAVQAESVFVRERQQRVRSGALAVDRRAARHRSRVAHLDRFDERHDAVHRLGGRAGRIVLATQLLGMSLERRPYEVAFENWKADVARRGTAVSADRDISRRRRSRRTSGCARTPARCACGSRAPTSGFDVKGYRQRLQRRHADDHARRRPRRWTRSTGCRTARKAR